MSDSGSLYRIYSAMCVGLEVVRVTVEVSISPGVGIFLVGLPDNAVRESLLRVTTALQRNGYSIPGRKTVVNLAPADIKKEGSGYDAAIAVAMLAASGQMFFPDPDGFLIMGELSLDGRLRKVRGALPIAVKAAQMGYKALVLPKESAAEASWASDIRVYGVSDLQEMAAVLGGGESASVFEAAHGKYVPRPVEAAFDLSEVAGQYFAKRGLEIAASGGHNMLLYGPPGSGKSMMSKCMASILPPMSLEEAVETSMVYSVAGLLDDTSGLVSHRPFRAPHHTASTVAVVGGGTRAMPGEISLAHNGVLYLDEIAQFAPATLEVLRQPLEDRHITVSRARYKVDFPASFMLVASMNPCPCGYAGEDDGRCTCTPAMIHRYRTRLSGPLLDRIDLNVNVRPVDSRSMSMIPSEESSMAVAERVAAVRALQAHRFAGEGIFTNAQMLPSHLQRFCKVEGESARLLQRLMDSYRLSARGYVRILKVARTIADMSGSEDIRPEHISEAAQYRFPDN
ncbi:MAG TPA: YifB family Mg chelatase-like AAA ATPase [Candidatus Coprenecus pullistercoris]|nr:YifB family Mg chelatase-like AAA ATPase [Candidatus Coprenecus pullistercoris]